VNSKTFEPGYMAGVKLLKSLGIDADQCVTRVIVDIPCDGIIKVYVQRHLTVAETDDFCATVAGCKVVVENVTEPLTVDEFGNLKHGE
jgi:hypothetical protein